MKESVDIVYNKATVGIVRINWIDKIFEINPL